MSTSVDTQTSPAGSPDRFRALLDEHRADCLRQREEALAECAQSVPDPVAQRRSADLQLTIAEIDTALARIDAGTYGTCDGCGGIDAVAGPDGAWTGVSASRSSTRTWMTLRCCRAARRARCSPSSR